MQRIPIAFAAALIALAGCDTASSGGDAAEAGIIRTTCGPTDGPATDLILSDSAMECGASPPADSYEGMVQGVNADQLKIGFEYKNVPLQACSRTDCGVEGDSLDIVFTDTAGAAVKGTYRIFNGGANVKTGEFRLKKCGSKYLFCG